MPRQYAAFISYRHLNNVAEARRWADWLHRWIEDYRVPPSLVGSQGLFGEVPARVAPVFRDELEMHGGGGLKDVIDEALHHSTALIVICSPLSAVSPWVIDEIRVFKELGREHRIIPVLIEGEPGATELANPGDEVRIARECLPRTFRFGYAIGPQTEDGKFPIYWSEPFQRTPCDLRPKGEFTQGFTNAKAYGIALRRTNDALPIDQRRSRQEQRAMVTAYAARLRLERLRIMSGLLGVGLDELNQRDAEARTRRLKQIVLGIGSLLLVALVSLAMFIRETLRARDLVHQASRSDHAAAENALRTGQWKEGVAYLLRALKYQPDNEAAATHLADALARPSGNGPVPWQWATLLPDNVTAATFNADGSLVATGCEDGRVRIFATTTGRPIEGDFRHSQEIRSIAFHPSGQSILACSKDGTVRLWSLAGKTSPPPIDLNGPARSVAFSPDGTRFAAGTDKGHVVLGDGSTGASLGLLLTADRGIGSFVWSPNGTRLAVQLGDKAELWNVENHQKLATVPYLGGCAYFTADSSAFYAAAQTGVNEPGGVIDATTGLPLPQEHPLHRLGAPLFGSPDGRWLLAREGPDQVALFNWSHGGGPIKRSSWKVPFNQVRAISPAADLIALHPSPNRLKIASPDAGGITDGVNPGFDSNWTNLAVEHDGFGGASFSFDGKWLLTWGQHRGDRTVRVYPASAFLSPPDPEQQLDGGKVLTVSNDLTLAACVDLRSGKVFFFDPKTQHRTEIPANAGGALWGTTLSKRGTFALLPFSSGGTAGPNPFTPAASLWSAREGREIPVSGKIFSSPDATVFSPDEVYLATEDPEHRVQLVETATGRLLSPSLPHPDDLHALDWSPSGAYLATGCYDGAARVWRVPECTLLGKPLTRPGASQKTGDPMSAVAFSPDGKLLAGGGPSGQVFLWTIPSLKLARQPLTHPKGVFDFAWASDNRRLATRCLEGEIYIWPITKSNPTPLVIRTGASVNAIAFSPDGHWLASAGDSQANRIWDAQTGMPAGEPWPALNGRDRIFWAADSHSVWLCSRNHESVHIEVPGERRFGPPRTLLGLPLPGWNGWTSFLDRRWPKADADRQLLSQASGAAELDRFGQWKPVSIAERLAAREKLRKALSAPSASDYGDASVTALLQSLIAEPK